MNLTLEILGKRPDGYHEISTVLQAVDLFDRLTVETADTISMETSDPGLPTDDGNLVVRAARLLRDAAGSRAGAHITLDHPADRLEVRAQYQRPQLGSNFPEDLLRVDVPQGVEIQDFR